MTYFRRECTRLSSARARFTVLFGMGRSGSTLPWSSDIACGCSALRARNSQSGRGEGLIAMRSIVHFTSLLRSVCCAVHRGDAHGYRIKPHGQLVPVSSRHYCPSTPGLSTSWSWTTLQEGCNAPGKSHLEAGFPLRCFQRLSLPYIATRRCHWRDNRNTIGSSNSVLSY